MFIFKQQDQQYNVINALPFSYFRYVDYDSDDEDETHPIWVNIPMFVFVAFSLGPFGMCLHYQYKILKPALKDNHASCSEVSNNEARTWYKFTFTFLSLSSY